MKLNRRSFLGALLALPFARNVKAENTKHLTFAERKAAWEGFEIEQYRQRYGHALTWHTFGK